MGLLANIVQRFTGSRMGTPKHETPIVRDLGRADLWHLTHLDLAWTSEPWQREDFLGWYNRPGCGVIVAEAPTGLGEAVGYCAFRELGVSVIVSRLAVEPNLRRCGIGRALVACCLGLAHERRKRRLVVHASERDLSSQLFLKSLGFRAVNTIRPVRGDGEALYMFVLNRPAPKAEG